MTIDSRVMHQSDTRAQRVRDRRARSTDRLYDRQPPRRKQIRKRPRRRYDVSLPIAVGAEMQLPSMPLLRPGPRWLSGVLLVICIWLAKLLLASGTFRVEPPIITGATLLTPAQVSSIARINGISAFVIDPDQVVSRLREYPEVAQAEVVIRWPNRIEININERRPEVEWLDGGRVWWISSDGIAFLGNGANDGLVQVVSSEPWLQITSDPLAPVVDPNLIHSALALRAQMPELEVLLFDAEKGLGLEDPRGWKAYFGTQGDIALKIQVYKAITENISAQGVAPTLVCVEDESAPYYR